MSIAFEVLISIPATASRLRSRRQMLHDSQHVLPLLSHPAVAASFLGTSPAAWRAVAHLTARPTPCVVVRAAAPPAPAHVLIGGRAGRGAALQRVITASVNEVLLRRDPVRAGPTEDGSRARVTAAETAGSALPPAGQQRA